MAVELGHREDVEAVLLAGSVARDQHRPSSDVDLLVVGPDISTLAVRVGVDGLLVERIAHSEAGWTQRLDRPRTSWAYAIREAVPLLDRGAGRRLQAAAGSFGPTEPATRSAHYWPQHCGTARRSSPEPAALTTRRRGTGRR